jgi:VCBS repeat protein/prenyltransferase/squalene oxidase-like repeat protein
VKIWRTGKVIGRRIAAGAAFLLVALLPAPAARATTPDDARVSAVAWLIRSQNGDGSWSATNGTPPGTVALGAQALRISGVSGFPYARAVSWLGNAELGSVDSLARAIVALQDAGVDVSSPAAQLVAARNASIGWGAYPGFGTSFPDTPLALAALRVGLSRYSVADTQAALCSILTAQNSTSDLAVKGSWSYAPAGAGAPASTTGAATLPTSTNVLELIATAARTDQATDWTRVTCGTTAYVLSTAVGSGIDWLVNRRANADGGFGDAGSTVAETALVYNVLTSQRPTNAKTAQTLAYLLAAQRADGSWNGDPWATALVLTVLPAPAASALVDTSGDGVPDVIKAALGTPDLRWLARGSPAPGSVARLTIAKAGTGQGTVVSGDGGIRCGGICASSYALGTSVQLSPSAATGSAFAGWSGDADCRTGGMTLSTNMLCVAVFSASVPTATLTVTLVGSGPPLGSITSFPSGISCVGVNTCSASYPAGTVVTLIGVGLRGTIVRYSGDPDCADGVVTLDTSKTCTATFDRQQAIAFGLGRGALSAGWIELMQPQSPYGTRQWIQEKWAEYNAGGETRPVFCDVDGDGVTELVVGLGPGSQGWLEIFKEVTIGWAHWLWLQLNWPSYNLANGETFPACGDLDGDGRDEIVIGLGAGGSGWLQLYKYIGDGLFIPMAGTSSPNGWIQVAWSQYNQDRGETHPAVGDITGDGHQEIVIGLGPGAGGWLQIFGDTSTGLAPIPGTSSPNGWVQAWTGGTGETRPALCDVRGDGTRDIVLGFGSGSAGWLQILGHSPAGSGASPNRWIGWVQVTWLGASSGETFPACGDLDGDGRDEIVVGLGAGAGGWAQLFNDAVADFAPLPDTPNARGWIQLHWPQYNTTPGYGLLRPAVVR